jgi:hypothetical protein
MYVETTPWKVQAGIFPKKLSFFAFKDSEWDIRYHFFSFFLIFLFHQFIGFICEFENLLKQLFLKIEHFMWKWHDEMWKGCIFKKIKIIIPWF